MENYDLVINDLKKYNEEELFYRDYYYARRSPETLADFLSAHTAEEVKKRKLICPELFKNDTSIQKESRFFQMENNKNVWIEKHNRYSPVYMHAHEYFEAFYVFSGSCEHTINGQSTVLSEGTLCLIAPYVEHSIGVFDDSIVLNIMMQRSTFDDIFFNELRTHNILSSFFLSNLYTNSKISSLSFHLVDDDLVELLLSMLLEEVVEDNYTFRILSHLISVFLTKVVRRYGKADADYTADSVLNETALNILSYINDHYRNTSLKETASYFGYTEAHCSRLIKSVTGQNFTQLLRNVRMRRAETLLLTTSNSIEEISYMIGYENSATFIRLFKQRNHVTPGKFRQQSALP
jgi:AraC-like DNA-binding protein/mannose-6-phosphate isomerase-like protein (cupin superfamily)